MCLTKDDLFCETDEKLQKRISENTLGKINTEGKKGKIINMKNKKIKTIIIAAVLVVILAFSGTAAYRFVLPQYVRDNFKNDAGLNFDSIKTVVNTEKANENEIFIVNESVKTDGYIITFEAVADTTRIQKSLFGEISEEVSTKYAVFTLRREDGGKVMYGDDEDDTLYAPDLGSLVLVDDYIPNPCMWQNSCDKYFCEEENVVYILFDISEAAIFADHELKLAVADKMVLTSSLFEKTEDGYAFKPSYSGRFAALYRFDLPDELKNEALQQEYLSSGTFNK